MLLSALVALAGISTPATAHHVGAFNAAWRYYNLADFAISAQDARMAVDVRMGFEDAQTYLGGMMVDPMWAGAAAAKPSAPDEGRAAAVIDGMVRVLARFMVMAARTADAGEAGRFLPRR
ncbi:MAG: hypothetical protein ACRDHY_12860 [Anaerolineales bacterium]